MRLFSISLQLSIAFLVFILVTQSQQAPCRKNSKARKILKNIRKNYMLVEKPKTPSVPVFPRPRRDVTSTSPTDSKYCPWRWVKDTSLPPGSSLLKAQCIGKCKIYCKPVYYNIKVLVNQGRNSRVKMDVWKLVSKRIVVAYVYSDKIWSIWRLTGTKIWMNDKITKAECQTLMYAYQLD